MNQDEMDRLLMEKDVRGLVYFYFGYKLTDGQARIVRAIAFREAPKITIKCYTQYGKTRSVALGIALHKLLWSGNHYRLVASQDSKTAILRSYVAEAVAECSILSEQLTIGAVGVQKITTEVSRKRLTFKDGDDLKVLSAQGDAQRLMGEGGNIIVVDETGEISSDVFNGKIMRMVGAYSTDYMIVEIGNPWDPNSHFAEHWNDPRTPEQGGWLKIHIGWDQGVLEERVSRQFIEERRNELVPMEFRVLYDAEFPEESEDQLIKREWFEAALSMKLQLKVPEIRAGLDVAEMGLDETVLIVGVKDGRNFKVEKIYSWSRQDTMPTVGAVSKTIHENARINVDATGVGSGVCSRLSELGLRAYPYKGGERPQDPKDQERFRNKLAAWYWNLREIFEQGRIDLHELQSQPVELRKLQVQLFSIKYEIQSDRLIRILKPADQGQKLISEHKIKSPDFSDALMLFAGDPKRGGVSTM